MSLKSTDSITKDDEEDDDVTITSPRVTSPGSKKVKPRNRKPNHHQFRFDDPNFVITSDGGITGIDVENIENGNDFGLRQLEKELVFEVSPPVRRVYVRRRKKRLDYAEKLLLIEEGGVGFNDRGEELKEGGDKKRGDNFRLESRGVGSDDFGDREEGFEEGRENCGDLRVESGEKRRDGMGLSVVEMEKGLRLESGEGGESSVDKRRNGDGLSVVDLEGDGGKKRKRVTSNELAKLGVGLETEDLRRPRLRENRNSLSRSGNKKRKNCVTVENSMKMKSPVCPTTKRWVWYAFLPPVLMTFLVTMCSYVVCGI